MRPERGAVTVLAIAVGSFMSLIAVVIVQASALVRLQHEVTKAADLAALAASQASVAGRDPCPAAADVARRNHAVMVRCRMDFDVATITARGEAGAIWGERFGVNRMARAAPVDYLGR